MRRARRPPRVRTGDDPRGQVALHGAAAHVPLAGGGGRGQRDKRLAARHAALGRKQILRPIERGAREQVDLAVERQIRDEVGREPHGAAHRPAERRQRILHERAAVAGHGRGHDAARVDVLQHASLQMPQAPRDLAVIVSVAVGRRRVGRVDAADAGLQDLRLVRRTLDARQRDRNVAGSRRNLDDARARRDVALQVRPHQVRTGGKLVQREAPAAIRHREYAGAAQGRNDDADKRLPPFVQHQSPQFGLRDGGDLDNRGGGGGRELRGRRKRTHDARQEHQHRRRAFGE